MRVAKFFEEQLLWLDEYPNCFVAVLKQPKGKPFQESGAAQIIKIRALSEFIAKNYSENLWRSWNVYRDHELQKVIGPIPLVIDIDNESDGNPNLKHAYELTRICLEELLEENDYWSGISSDHLRVIFSGHKGFHIELKPPKPIDAQVLRQKLIALCSNREAIHQFGNIFFDSTVIDVFHDHVRLTGSINSWTNKDSKILSRKVIQMTILDFNRLNLQGILEISEAI